ncbi:MAG: SDR family oxidoreductase [Nitrosarchaeum sp.]
MKEKLFVLGIGGLTGSKFSEVARDDFEIFGSYNFRDPKLSFINSVSLDITNASKIEQILEKIKPDVVINTTGINNVDYCEKHTEETRKINVLAVKEICKITKKMGIKLVQLSSDSVFDGNKQLPYVETDSSNPINYYGKTKLESENIVLENTDNVVVRASVLYGYLLRNIAELESSSKKSINFGQWLINKLIAKEKVRIITDEYSSPIIADDFARSILHLIKHNAKGIFHSAPKLQITRYDFSIEIAKALSLPLELIEPVSNMELGRNVNTGTNKCLNSEKLSKNLNYKFLTLDESLDLLKTQFREGK